MRGCYEITLIPITGSINISGHRHTKNLRTLIYYGPERHAQATALAAYDIVLKTYNILASEWEKAQKSREATVLLPSYQWHREVLDEGIQPCWIHGDGVNEIISRGLGINR